MNLNPFTTHRDGFNMLDLRAHFDFKTATSIGFRVGPIPKGSVARTIFGAVQVHHPCNQHVQTKIYIQLPQQYKDDGRLDQIRASIFQELNIPHDETYEMHYTGTADSMSLEQHVNREGLTDVI